jgi:cyclic-di-GMP phosphodiesterase TipF (flagellum assembly factor)
MARITHIFIAVSYCAAALLVSALLVNFELADVTQAWTLGVVLALTAGHIHVIASRDGAQSGVVGEIRKLADSKRDLADEIAALRNRIDRLESGVMEEGEERHAAIVGEMRTLERLVQTMARRMDDRIGSMRRAGGDSGRSAAGASSEAILIASVRDALTAGRVDLHLQPIVSLPQRKTYYYEGFSRLRDADGGVIMPAEWLRIAEHSGLVAEIDNLLLFRCVQIVRRLAQKERKIGVFCNISAASLADDEFFPQFLDFVRQHSDLSGSLIFEIGQQSFRDRGLGAARNMARLADFGFRFSIDKVTDIDLDLADLRRAGVKFVKAPGDLLISTLKAGEPLGLSAAPEIRAEDFPSLLAKYGVELIAEKIEDEATVVEVLELDVGLAQGHLFGAPKPLKDGVLAEADAARDRSGARRATG